jgi:hypothetical protein
MITQFEERLSWVPRWCIVRTIQKQSVAEHSFRVAVAAARIARMYHVTQLVDLYEIQRLALLHDWSEALSADIPSPSKGWFRTTEFEGHFADRMGEPLTRNPLHIRMVKIADTYEAILFLYVEKSLGNKSVENIKNNLVNTLRNECRNEDIFEKLHASAAAFGSEQQDPLR